MENKSSQKVIKNKKGEEMITIKQHQEEIKKGFGNFLTYLIKMRYLTPKQVQKIQTAGRNGEMMF